MAEATITIEITRAINRLEEGHIKIPYFAGQVVKVTEETAKTAVAEGWGKVVAKEGVAKEGDINIAQPDGARRRKG